MNLDELEQKIKEYNISKDPLWEGVDYSNDCVDYETAALLFDWQFNEPCLTYFHNVDDYEGYEEGTPEHDEWSYREENWEMCAGDFLNYPDNFVVRYRYARPTYIQVLRWFEKKFGMRIFVGADWVTINHLPKYINENNRVLIEMDYNEEDTLPNMARKAVELVVSNLKKDLD